MSKGKRGGFSVLFFSKTDWSKTFKRLRLLSITKLQNLKAIHNAYALPSCRALVVINHKLQNLKAIHNAILSSPTNSVVVINHKATKFESNSQPITVNYQPDNRCYQSQNYKIWKQFTTWENVKGAFSSLLSITKLQNLKAIHNKHTQRQTNRVVVINRKTTKFESNSQLYLILLTNKTLPW